MSGKAENTNVEQYKIVQTADGGDTVYSERFGEHYHSLGGSLGESIYVYCKQGLEYFCNLFPKHKNITIFEVGFGAGLNAYVTLLYAKDKDININYISVEKYPLDVDSLENFSLGEMEQFRKLFFLLHRAPWNKWTHIIPNFRILKVRGDWTQCDLESQLKDDKIDVIYYDAFSYDTQPEMWTAERFKYLFENTADGGVLTTYAAKGEIKRNLLEAGFYIERLKGALKKRHMLRAIKPIRGQNLMRYINISNIKFDNIPINLDTLDLAMKIYMGQINPDDLPPIRVKKLPSGQYLIRDGRHRATAFKLNGLKQIKAYIFTPKPK